MAVWGSFSSDDVIGKEYMPCLNKRGKANIHGCQTTAENLGIAFRQRRNTDGNPVAGDKENVPGPVPLDMEPNVQPGEPWDRSPIPDEELIAAEEYTGVPIKKRALERSIYPTLQRNSSLTIVKHRQRVARVLRNSRMPIPRGVNQDSDASTVPSDTYAATSWPTGLTGTLVLPTSESVSTLTDSSFRTLVATGLVPGTHVGTSSDSRTTTSPSLSCTMHMQVGVPHSIHRIEKLIRSRIRILVSLQHSVCVKAAKRSRLSLYRQRRR